VVAGSSQLGKQVHRHRRGCCTQDALWSRQHTVMHHKAARSAAPAALPLTRRTVQQQAAGGSTEPLEQIRSPRGQDDHL